MPKDKARNPKSETNPKSQAPTLKQIANPRIQTPSRPYLSLIVDLVIGTCLGFGACDLVFVADFVRRISSFPYRGGAMPRYFESLGFMAAGSGSRGVSEPEALFNMFLIGPVRVGNGSWENSGFLLVP